MPTGILVPLIFAAALGSGLMAGTFFAFSVFVMGALGRLPPEQGIAAMQSINIVVINRVFLAVFAGTAVISAALALTAVLGWHADGADWILTGSPRGLAHLSRAMDQLEPRADSGTPGRARLLPDGAPGHAVMRGACPQGPRPKVTQRSWDSGS